MDVFFPVECRFGDNPTDGIGGPAVDDAGTVYIVRDDSAYPGSMLQREDGSFVRREDADSLAGALLALVKSGDRAAEDLRDAMIQYKKDAERYMFLRRGQHWSVIDGIGDTLRADALDAAIDAAMKTPNAKVSGAGTASAGLPG